MNLYYLSDFYPPMKTIAKLSVVLAAIILNAAMLRAQYSSDVFNLKKAQDLWDQRGYAQGAALSVDGRLIVSEANGIPTYHYPISEFTIGGYPFSSELNYCGSVAFTIFNKYHAAHDNPDGSVDPYYGWSKFHQNRPAWIIGINGWAVQVISTTANFHADPNSRMKFSNLESFNDSDIVQVIDGYDFCNRMIDFGAKGAGAVTGNTYVDNIRLLRSDGSVLELANVNAPNLTHVDRRPELYTGYYLPMEANARSYARVDFDSLYWPFYITQQLGSFNHDDRRPFIPRVVRYYQGDGLEYVFREWVVPYGTKPFYTYDSVAGGRYAGPTIFYLEEINGANGNLMTFTRSRHYPVQPSFFSGIHLDSTRGRALMLNFAGHEISYGVNSLMIQSFGRTTQVKFGKVLPSGNGHETTWMPLGSHGYAMDITRDMANWAETEPNLYKSYLGMVTEIIDPEGRKTTFTYEPYQRKYRGFGFPHGGSNVTLALNNLRLKEVTEPTSRYVISYYNKEYDASYGDVENLFVAGGGDTITIQNNDGAGSDHDMAKLNNVVAVLKKYDRSNTLLTTERFRFTYQASSTFAPTSLHRTIDNIANDTTSVEFQYRRYSLPNLAPLLPPPLYTVTTSVTATAKGETRVTNTYYSSSTSVSQLSAYGSQYPISTPKWGTPFLILDTASQTVVNGIEKSFVTYSYTIDTVRRYGTSTLLAGLLGQDITQKVTTVRRPGSHTPLLSTTTDFLNLPLVDTVGTIYLKRYDKFAMYRRHDSLVALGLAPERMKWEEMERDPRILAVLIDTVYNWAHVPSAGLLEKRTVVRDSSGNYLAGKVAAYNATVDPTSSYTWEGYGLKLYDSAIGEGGAKRILIGSYTYDGRRLRTTSNAFGVGMLLGYDYALPDDAVPNAEPKGLLLDNHDTVAEYGMRPAAYGNFTERPVSERAYVRRYQPGGSLDTLRLTTYKERSFYGLESGVLDPNGVYSRYAYDANGRLKTAWLPGDFQNPDSVFAREYQATDSSEGYGHTDYNVNFRWIDCVVTDTITPPLDSLTAHTDYGALYADNPTIVAPDCPPCNEAEEKHPGRAIQAACWSPIQYIERTPAIGRFSIATVPPGTTSIVSLDSAYLRLYITSVLGECVNFTVRIPALNVVKTFTLNCDANGTNGEEGGNRAEKRDRGRSMQSAGGNGGYFLKVPLTSVKDSLLGYTAGERFTVTIEVTTAGARVECVSGYSSSDKRPQLFLKGTFRQVNHLADYTLHYDYNDNDLTATVSAKVDDSAHTANLLDSAALFNYSRYTTARRYFGSGGRVLRSESTVREDNGTLRVDTTRYVYTGVGRASKTKDAEGDSVETRYDGLGRPVEVTNADGTHTVIAYIYGTPSALGITDQDFYGWGMAKTATNENGVKFTTYTDAFDRVRREVSDSNGLRLTTRYEYDIQGRMTQVVNPKGDTTRYWYDMFGRIRYKRQPDVGVISYAYDKLGRVRFVQDNMQGAQRRLNYNQYDDLGRLTVTGEAYFNTGDSNYTCGGDYDEDANYGDWECGVWMGNGTHRKDDPVEKTKRAGRTMQSALSDPAPDRLTNQLNPDTLHTWPTSSIPTANLTMWETPVRSVPAIPQFLKVVQNCGQLQANALLGETTAPAGPFLMHPTTFYNGTIPGATFDDFENIARHPEFVRIAVAYDSIPPSAGAVWSGFPGKAQWDALAPRGTVRNLRGREVAVAYRERGNEPFHYTVMSYDERGRVEALLRYTENLGFDGVYYTYNSMNQVTAVTVADFLRQHTTWYGYDGAGRIDSVWTSLSASGSGLWVNAQLHAPAPQARPDTADIVYRYTKTGQVDSMLYPPVNVLVKYAYNHRKWLDSLVATRSGSSLFREVLSYDPTGQITRQVWQQGSNARQKQQYSYDSLQRLTAWTKGPEQTGTVPPDTSFYTYDAAGNRLSLRESWRPQTETYLVSPFTSEGNQLIGRRRANGMGGDTINSYSYNLNGGVNSRWLSYETSVAATLLESESYGLSYRGLTRRAYIEQFPSGVGGPSNFKDWRYRYSASGEREQKRLYDANQNDSTIRYPWVYYMLGGAKEQLAVYNGQQTRKTMCGDTGRRVYLYPVHYLSYGLGRSANVLTPPNAAKRYVIADHLGSARSTVDAGGTVGTQDYTPFGETQVSTGIAARKAFIDREIDLESGEGSFGVRLYDAASGRFLSTDALWEKHRSTAPYQYALNNPTSLLDPSGLDSTKATSAQPSAHPALRIIGGAINAYLGWKSIAGGVGAIIVTRGAPAGVGAGVAMISTGYVSAGLGIAQVIDGIDAINDDRPTQNIPGSTGEALGMVAEKEFGWTWAPFVFDLTETLVTKGFNVKDEKDLGPLGGTVVNTALQLADWTFVEQHPSPSSTPKAKGAGHARINMVPFRVQPKTLGIDTDLYDN